MLKKVVGLYFSPSGGTAEITKRITESIAEVVQVSSVEDVVCECYDIIRKPLEEDMYFDEDTVVVLGISVFTGRLPLPAIKMINQLHGGGAMMVGVVCYGNTSYGDSLYELYAFAGDQGFRTIAAGAFITRHGMFERLAQDRPDENDYAMARSFADNAAGKILRLSGSLVHGLRIEPAPLDIKGCMPSKGPVKMPLHPTPGKNCVLCGECARICPVQAISHDDPAKINVKKCISCTACIKSCPNGSRGMYGPFAEASRLAMEVMYRRRKEPEWFI